MNADRYQRIKPIFLAASELEPEQVAAFLDQACVGDVELRREVESLLLHNLSDTIIGKWSGEDDPNQTRTGSRPAADRTAGWERFPPGTVLAGRYRIVGPLGRGGMGDVYRADDLKLNQPVALKFLSRGRAEDPAWLRCYENEVRLARKVTHPNVMRVYDIVEAEGEVFISMEYVDGEDLASLLRRVGRLTGDKAIQIARQLCAGLGAAHDQGVLHRDLKPANVMIDGRGQVRIADFGIASLALPIVDRGPLVGTPTFMAPELFEGGMPSVSSDLYALGVILYEVITGRDPFAGASSPLRAQDTTVIRPSTVVPDVDPELERAILQCLERDPRQRPASAYATAVALPGGDPLATALAAGETPSPSMVAAAGAQSELHPWLAAGCLGVGLAALALVMWLADQTFLLPQAGLEKPPAVLVDKVEHVISAMGYESGGRDCRQGFAIDREFIKYAAASDDHRYVWRKLPGGQPPAVCFWYRAGVDQIAMPALLGELLPTDAFATEPGVLTVRLDGRGRLLQYIATANRTPLAAVAPPKVDWSAPFALAGLNLAKFLPVRAGRAPAMYADSLVAWEGAYPDDPTMLIRVEGAAADGRVVFFEVSPSWDPDWTDTDEGPSQLPKHAPVARLALNLVAVIGGGFLAWQNLRIGRGDQRGANRLIVFLLFLGFIDWLLGERHVADFAEEAAMFYLWMGRATLMAAIAWVSYFAVEPYVRRYWPQIMITWSRLLSGKFRDPLIGRDILIGGTCGLLLVLAMQLDILLHFSLGHPPPLPKLPGMAYDLGDVLGLQYRPSILVAGLMASITLTLVVLLLMLILRVAIRPAWLATAVAWLLLTVLQLTATSADVSYPWLTASVTVAIAMALLMRVGLVALIACSFFVFLIVNSPLTADFQAWYAPVGTVASALAAALLIYGYFNARTGQPSLWRRLLDA